MHNTNILIEDISEYFYRFEYKVRFHNKSGLYNVNRLSQGFIARLLNLVFKKSNAQFQNMDLTKPNYPAIDLADLKQKIAYQVTATNETDKIYCKHP